MTRHAFQLASLLFLAAAPVASQTAAQPADSATGAIPRIFDAWRDTEGPGCAIAVSRAGRLVYQHGFGMANLETGTPITPASIFHVASVSKQFTAMAIQLLARDGKLSLDDEVRKYLPELPSYGTPITIRHLLNHTSGLRDQWALLGLKRGRFEEDRITEADVLDIVTRQKSLNFLPSAEYLYSNTGYTLAAVIVKRVSGQSLRDFAQQRIFQPLGMHHTHFHDDYTMVVKGRAAGYARAGGAWRVSLPNYDTYGATSLFTTVGDLLLWQANFANPRVGDAALLRQMEIPAVLSNGDSTGYGLGLALTSHRGARVIEHGGADAGYRSYLGRYPEHGLAIAIACNAAQAAPSTLARSVAELYLDKLLRPAVAAAADSSPTSSNGVNVAARAGVYLQPTTLQVMELTVRNGRLYTARVGGTLLRPLSETRFSPGPGAELVFGNGPTAGFALHPSPGARPIPYEWQPPVTLTPGLLTPYAGTYYSEELDATYQVSSTDSTLLLKTGTSAPIRARPVFQDGFLGGGYTIQFTRGGRVVTGFQVTNGRMRRVAFVRTGK